MRILISSWKTENLRVPDMHVKLEDGLNFIQIPNGGGKTTIQKLIKASITNSLDQFKISKNNANGIMDLADKNDFQDEGLFELTLKIIDDENVGNDDEDRSDEITFQHKFNFHNDSITTRTSSGKLGMKAGWRPPSFLLDFMNHDHANVFIFKGDYLDPYFNEDPNKGLPVYDAIETFSGIKDIKSSLIRLDEEFKAANASKVKKKQSTSENKLAAAVDQHKKLQKKLKDCNDNISQHEHIISELKSKGEDDLNIINFRKQKDDIDKEIQDLEKDLLTKESELSLLLSNPFNISNKISDLAINFNNKLEKARLPGYASEFFVDIAEGHDECICGEKLNDAKRKLILKNKENYLNAGDVDIVNRIKHTVNIKTADADEKEVSKKVKEIDDRFQDLLDKKKISENFERKINKSSLTEDEFKLLESTKDKLEKLKDDRSHLEAEPITLKRLKRFTKDDIYTLRSVNDTKKLVELLEQEAAEAGGYATALRQKNIFMNAINDALRTAYIDVCEEIKVEVNRKISKSHHDQTFKVSSIDQKIHIEGSSEGGSGGQNVIAVTAFATTLLERSKANFPLLIDHPVTALQNDSRGEISNMLYNLNSQVICLVIDTEKSCFITKLDNKTLLPNSENSNLITVTRYDRDVALGLDIPNDDKTVKSKNGIVSTNREFFTNFKMEDQD